MVFSASVLFASDCLCGANGRHCGKNLQSSAHLSKEQAMHMHTSNQECLHLGYRDYTCNWGAHIAALYESADEKDELVFGFLARGMHEHECVLYGCCTRTVEEFTRHFLTRHPGLRTAIEDTNKTRICAARDGYCGSGAFSPQKMATALEEYYQYTQRNGRCNVRAAADMCWANDSIAGINTLMNYESRLNEFIAGKPWISICLYDVNRFDGGMIMQVLQTHPFVISNGAIIENPYYMNPREWLEKYASHEK